jgi:hypothetical protein
VAQDVTEFGELIDILRGMRGQLVEAAIFLPWDDGGFPVAQFSGTLREVEYQEKSHQPRWVLSWVEDGEGKPHYPEVAIWERRFLRAELSFTGDGHSVRLRPVNDPSQIDIEVTTDRSELLLAIEVKQKPATTADAEDIARAANARGCDRALLCGLDKGQRRLDDEELQSRADRELRVILRIAYSVDEVIRVALFSSDAPRRQFIADFVCEVTTALQDLDGSADGIGQWTALARRWSQDS